MYMMNNQDKCELAYSLRQCEWHYRVSGNKSCVTCSNSQVLGQDIQNNFEKEDILVWILQEYGTVMMMIHCCCYFVYQVYFPTTVIRLH